MKQVKKWRVQYYKGGAKLDSFEWFSRVKPTRKAKNGLSAGETFEIILLED